MTANSFDYAEAVAIQPNGKIVAVGVSGSSFALARYDANGSLDVNFGAGGKAIINFGADSDDKLNNLALDSSGRTIAVGSANGLPAVARFLGDGGVQSAGRTPFDFDGDGRADISVFRSSEANWYISGSQNGFTGIKWGSSTDNLAPADYDGDGKTDVAVYRGGQWIISQSSSGAVRYQTFGLSSDQPIAAAFAF